MPFCLKCGTEYRSGYKLCSDCRSELTENPPAPPVAVSEKTSPVEGWVLLKNVYHDIEADLICGLLSTHGIPNLKKYPDFSMYLKVYFGSAMGVDIMVPAEYLPEAAAILLAQPIPDHN